MADAFPISASVLRDGCGNVALDCCTSLNHCGWTLSLKCSQMLLSTQHARIAKRALPTEHSILFAMKRNRAFSFRMRFQLSSLLQINDSWNSFQLHWWQFGVQMASWGLGLVEMLDRIILSVGLLWYPLRQQVLWKGDCWQSSTAVKHQTHVRRGSVLGHRHCSIWIDTCGRPMLVG